LAARRKALGDAGFAEGRNLDIKYRRTGTDQNLLPSLAADLVGRRVDVILSPTIDAAQAAMSRPRAEE
jgi:putative ABC transport system substrate-binding protein